MNNKNVESAAPAILEHFRELDDPRRDINKRHKLIDIITIAICASICGADKWTQIADFGNAKCDWLCKFLELPNGIPSHDTFRRIFARITPESFHACFQTWVQSIFSATNGQVVAIDGKTARRSGNSKSDQPPLHIVSAWASANNILLGQIKTDDKSNEITAIPALLNMLDVAGCIVTIDAMGCQKKIAEQIVKANGDYIFGLKGNQSGLYDEVKQLFGELQDGPFDDVEESCYVTENKGHGRHELREYHVVKNLGIIGREIEWPGLQCFAKIISTRTQNEKTSVEERYYITTLNCNARRFGQAARSHWSVENSLHWILDMAFREDESRTWKDNAPENQALLNRLALSLLKQEKSYKRGIASKRLRAGWDSKYLELILTPPKKCA